MIQCSFSKERKVKQWSISRLKSYEECPLRIRFKYIDKIPEPPLPPDSPAHRGNLVHDHLEQYVSGQVDDLPKTKQMGKFIAPLKELRDLYAEGKISLENECGVDQDWNYIDNWSDAWGILKMDAEVIDGDTGRVIDYKTGKSMYNRVKHGEQVQFYQSVFLSKWANVQTVTTELWYLDEGHVDQMKFTRKQGQKFINGIKKRAEKMCSDTTFEPNPNKFSCRFCVYGPGSDYQGNPKLGLCGVGIEVYP